MEKCEVAEDDQVRRHSRHPGHGGTQAETSESNTLADEAADVDDACPRCVVLGHNRSELGEHTLDGQVCHILPSIKSAIRHPNN